MGDSRHDDPPANRGWNNAVYGDRIAAAYDGFTDMYGGPREDVVDFIDEAAGPHGTILEAGVGTGRIAIPLALRGHPVCGIDSSRAMLDALREKEHGELVETVEADCTRADLGREFNAVVAVQHTFLHFASLDEQRAFLQNAKHHLAPEGVIVIHARRPDEELSKKGYRVQPWHIAPDAMSLEFVLYDRDSQVAKRQHLRIDNAGWNLYPAITREVDVEELDELAAAAGLKLAQRWGSWQRAAFSPSSNRHISIYRNAL